VPDKWIFTVFDAMRRTPRHRFMVLTKRPARMSRVLDGMEPAPNVWLGVSMESNLCEARVQTLDSMDPQWPRWVSAEPLLGPLSFPKFRRLDFVVCGCESGPGRRPMDAQWARCLRDWCADNGSRFMLKQMVVDGTLERLPELDGRRHADRPGSEAA
jgi:protein gp37